MGFQYGIKICEETLLRLSSEEDMDGQLHNSWSEIDVIKEDDVVCEHYKAINQWKQRYLSRTQFSINPEGKIKSGEDGEMQILATDLQKLCQQIIDKNTKEIQKEP